MFPKIDPSSFVDARAIIIGDVNVGPGCSVWPGAIIRGDLNHVEIGEGSNIQDNAVVHVTPENPTRIGSNVSVGHCAIVHACTIGNDVIVGMNSSVLDGSVVGDGCIIGAGAVVREGTVIPPNSLFVGVPGKVIRTDETLRLRALENAETYHRLRDEHRSGNQPDWHSFCYTLMPIEALRDHEEIKPPALEKLTEAIRNDGELQKPVLVDKVHHVVLDGHHRLNALRAIGVKMVPVYLVDYFDARIELHFWPDAEVHGFGYDNVDKQAVIDKACAGEVYPPKTTRHIINITVPNYTTPLDILF